MKNLAPETTRLMQAARNTRDNLTQLTSANPAERQEILRVVRQLGVANRAILTAALGELVEDITPDSARAE